MKLSVESSLRVRVRVKVRVSVSVGLGRNFLKWMVGLGVCWGSAEWMRTSPTDMHDLYPPLHMGFSRMDEDHNGDIWMQGIHNIHNIHNGCMRITMAEYRNGCRSTQPHPCPWYIAVVLPALTLSPGTSRWCIDHTSIKPRHNCNPNVLLTTTLTLTCP